MASVDTLSFEIVGFDTVIQAIKELENDVKKVNEIRKILRRQAEPTKRVMIQQAPQIKGDRTIKYSRNKSIEYKPGNLKRAIRLFNGRNKDFPTVYVGAQAKKPEGSGYYSYFIQYGTNRPDGRGIKRKNNYVKTTDELIGDIMGEQASGELVKYIERKAKRLGFV